MKRTHFTEEQIVCALKESEAGAPKRLRCLASICIRGGSFEAIVANLFQASVRSSESRDTWGTLNIPKRPRRCFGFFSPPVQTRILGSV